MKKKILLLGLGMQGKAALYDLVEKSDAGTIIVVDNGPDIDAYLRRYPGGRVIGKTLDATDEERLAPLMRRADVAIDALPGELALSVGRLAAECGTNLVSSMYYVDPGEVDAERIEYLQRQVEQLDEKAKRKGVTILTEFGLDPGLDLIMAASAISQLEKVEEFYTYGAGIPKPGAAQNPLKYKFSWSIIGVMRAYRRPARVISGGRPMDIGAKSIFEPGNCHIVNAEGFGSPLECYPNGDGVRYAELLGIQDSVRETARYTCRLPGHCAFWDVMVKSGFLDDRDIEVGNVRVSPLQFTASLLGSQEQFHYSGEEQDVTLLRVDARGLHGGKRTRVIYQLLDQRDLGTGFTSMQRTVGFTLSLGARTMLSGKLRNPGLLSPLDVDYDLVFPELEEYGIHVSRSELAWN